MHDKHIHQEGNHMFTITRLVNDRAIVRGTDVFGTEGTTTVSTKQWDEVQADTQYKQAEADFESTVEEFFKPLTDAHNAMHQKLERPTDASSYIVLDEGSEGVPAQPRHLIRLNRDSVILRLVEQGDISRLVWVDDELEILEVLPVSNGGAATPVTTDDSLSDEAVIGKGDNALA
jgi:hypothetical protein